MATGRLCIDYLTVKDIKAIGGATFTAGSGSQNLSNNTGITFIPISSVTGPSVSITSNPVATNLVYGNEVVFTATNTNNVASTLFNWFVNNISVQNTTSNIFRSSTLLNGSVIKCTISEPYVDVNYPTACSFYLNALSNSINVIATPAPTFTAQPSTAVCAGVDVTYTTQASQSNYVWAIPGILNTDYSITAGGVGNTSNTVTLKWLTAGSKTVTINYSNSGGNSASIATPSTATTVNAAPTPTFTAQPGASACLGVDVTYTTQASQSNYVWTVPGTLNTNYSITSGSLGTTSNTVTLKWLTAGSKTVSINYSSSGGCSASTAISSTATTVGNPTPTFTAQAGVTACVGVDVIYTTQASQSNYVWTVPGTLNTDYSITSGSLGSNSNTVTLKWLNAGAKTVTINYTSTGGCSASTPTSSTATTVNAMPIITGLVTVKVGNTIALTGNGSPAASNAWRSANANATISNSGVVTGVTVGTSVITYTNSSGCEQVTTINIESAPLPVNLISFNAKTQNNSVFLNWSTASEQNNSYFKLSHATDGFNFTLLNTIKAAANGNIQNTYSYGHLSPVSGLNYYHLEQVDLDGTVKDLGVKAVNFSLFGTQKVVVYPNPTQNEVKVIFDKDFYTLAKVIDMQGKVLLKKSIAIHESELSFDMKSLEAGNYLIQLEGKTTYIQKVVKQ